MSGYIPIFDTVFNGSMHGKWPTLPVWLTILPLADRHGHIDLTPEAIAARTGWPIDLLLEGIKDLCEPDPRSRSDAEGGARLVLIDDHRDWGWRIVNHGAYREKARKQMNDIERVASGENAERLRARRAATSGNPLRPATTRANPLSDSDSDSNSNKERDIRGRELRATRSAATRLPNDFELTDDRMAVASAQGLEPSRVFENFRDYWQAESGAQARKNDWDAAWRYWCRNQADRRVSTGANGTKFARHMEALGRA